MKTWSLTQFMPDTLLAVAHLSSNDPSQSLRCCAAVAAVAAIAARVPAEGRSALCRHERCPARQNSGRKATRSQPSWQSKQSPPPAGSGAI